MEILIRSQIYKLEFSRQIGVGDINLGVVKLQMVFKAVGLDQVDMSVHNKENNPGLNPGTLQN